MFDCSETAMSKEENEWFFEWDRSEKIPTKDYEWENLTKPTIWNLRLVQSMAVKLIKLDNLKIKKLKLKSRDITWLILRYSL